jgi:hypothetical protein
MTLCTACENTENSPDVFETQRDRASFRFALCLNTTLALCLARGSFCHGLLG